MNKVYIPMESTFPAVPKDLLDKLEELYPKPCPSPGDTYDAIFYKSGQNNVVKFLAEQYKRQNETII
tara:strand:+ start:1749 stop:1949 length:201 start_codon:yes stop_codon:yes gene_type:complete